jgi:predicted O-methyltransferase YrrM
MPLIYQKERPGLDGFYFVRVRKDGTIFTTVVKVSPYLGQIIALLDGSYVPVNDDRFVAFAGPLLMPTDESSPGAFTKCCSPTMESGPGSWNLHVVPLLKDVVNTQWLEVGSYEGRSAVWTARNVLRGEKSKIVCIDLWSTQWCKPNPQESIFDHNAKNDPRIIKIKGLSRDILPTLPRATFHGAYIDGSHDEADVYADACSVFPLLVPGGVLIFDDYEGMTMNGQALPTISDRRLFGVYAAVNKFFEQNKTTLRWIWPGYQAILQKL